MRGGGEEAKNCEYPTRSHTPPPRRSIDAVTNTNPKVPQTSPELITHPAARSTRTAVSTEKGDAQPLPLPLPFCYFHSFTSFISLVALSGVSFQMSVYPHPGLSISLIPLRPREQKIRSGLA